MDELFWTLRLAKDTFASYAAQFQKEGECRWESGTPDFSFHSLRESLSPAFCFSATDPSALPTPFSLRPRGYRHPGPSSSPFRRPSPHLFRIPSLMPFNFEI